MGCFGSWGQGAERGSAACPAGVGSSRQSWRRAAAPRGSPPAGLSETETQVTMLIRSRARGQRPGGPAREGRARGSLRQLHRRGSVLQPALQGCPACTDSPVLKTTAYPTSCPGQAWALQKDVVEKLKVYFSNKIHSHKITLSFPCWGTGAWFLPALLPLPSPQSGATQGHRWGREGSDALL